MSFKVISIPEYITEQVRSTLASPQYKHPASISLATGYGPCRSCLRKLEVGVDERILFTYNSFEGLSDLPLPGPVFVHKDNCEAFDSADEFPPDLLDLPLLFECFGDESEMLMRERVDASGIGEQLERLFGLPGARFVNIRNAEAGCFVARVDRIE